MDFIEMYGLPIWILIALICLVLGVYFTTQRKLARKAQVASLGKRPLPQTEHTCAERSTLAPCIAAQSLELLPGLWQTSRCAWRMFLLVLWPGAGQRYSPKKANVHASLVYQHASGGYDRAVTNIPAGKPVRSAIVSWYPSHAKASSTMTR
jgi:hypothetical protein